MKQKLINLTKTQLMDAVETTLNGKVSGYVSRPNSQTVMVRLADSETPDGYVFFTITVKEETS